MANEDKKDFNKQLNDPKKIAKIVELDEKGAEKWGGKTMVVAPPKDYDLLIKKIEKGKLATADTLRKAIAKQYKTEITCPLTCGIFTNIVAWASYQRDKDITPFWRTIKSDGSLNPKFPEYPTLQKELLEQEGHEIIEKKGKYLVKNFEEKLMDL